ncbi:MAG: hypothetical protein ABIP81_01690 [Terriglobales bacterium]
MKMRLLAVVVFLLTGMQTLLAGDADVQTRPRPAVDPCKLISAADIKRVQHTVLKETKPSLMSSSSAMSMRQCFYRTESHVDSISLLIAESSKDQPHAAREYWDATLVKASETEIKPPPSGEMTKADAKKQRHKPERIPGLGDQAWWVGDRATGALYVLSGDRFFRISIGGKLEDDKKTRMKALAAVVLKKL